jgi:hypothetical protein
MSVAIHVDAYSGYKANERPLRFWLDAAEPNQPAGIHEIEEVESRWYEPDAQYFRVRTTDQKRYLLRYDEREGAWSLQSAGY